MALGMLNFNKGGGLLGMFSMFNGGQQGQGQAKDPWANVKTQPENVPAVEPEQTAVPSAPAAKPQLGNTVSPLYQNSQFPYIEGINSPRSSPGNDTYSPFVNAPITHKSQAPTGQELFQNIAGMPAQSNPSGNAWQLFQKLNDGSITELEMEELNRLKQQNPEALNQLNNTWKPEAPANAPSQGMNDYDPAFQPPSSTNTSKDLSFGNSMMDPGQIINNKTYGGRREGSSFDNFKEDVSNAFGGNSPTNPLPVDPNKGMPVAPYNVGYAPTQGAVMDFRPDDGQGFNDDPPGKNQSFLDARNIAEEYMTKYQNADNMESSKNQFLAGQQGLVDEVGQMNPDKLTPDGNFKEQYTGEGDADWREYERYLERTKSMSDPNSVLNKLPTLNNQLNDANISSKSPLNMDENMKQMLSNEWSKEQPLSTFQDPVSTDTGKPTDQEIGSALSTGDPYTQIPNNSYQDMLSLATQMTDGTEEQYRDMMNRIGYHESGMTMDPNQLQGGGGPGRGLYQFDGNSLPTAINRSINAYKSQGMEIPNWLLSLQAEGITNATNLTPEMQSALAVGNILAQSGSTNSLNQYFSGDDTLDNLWADYHWQGNTADRNARMTSFNKHNDVYNGQTFEKTPITNSPFPSFNPSIRR